MGVCDRRGEWALGRGGAGADRDLECGIGGEWCDRTERHGAAVQGVLDRTAGGLVGVDLGRCRQPKRLGTAAVDGQRRDVEHRGGIDALIEHGDEHRGQRQALGLADELCDRGGRGAERPRHLLGECRTVGRPGAGRNDRPVLGRCREPVDHAGDQLEPQGAGADPPPAAVDRWCDLDGNVGGVELLERRQRHHRLIEGDTEERGDVDGALGLEAQHLERAGGGLTRTGRTGWRRKHRIDRVADQRGSQRLGRTIELLPIDGGYDPGREPFDDRLDLGGREGVALDDVDLVGPRRDGCALAEPQAERSTRLIDHVDALDRHDRFVDRGTRRGAGRGIAVVVATAPTAGQQQRCGDHRCARPLSCARPARHRATHLVVIVNLTKPAQV